MTDTTPRTDDWRWAPAGASDLDVGGTAPFGTTAWNQLHLLAPRADGHAAAHHVLESSDELKVLPDLALGSISSVAGSETWLAVAGASADGSRPTVLLLAQDGAVQQTIDLSTAEPVAAWPLLVASGPDLSVVWSAGEWEHAGLWLEHVPAQRRTRTPVLTDVAVLDLRAASAGEPHLLDVTCYGTHLRFVRLREDKLEIDRVLTIPNASSASLLGGTLWTPAGRHAFGIWDPTNDASRTLAVPEPPEAGNAQVRRPRLIEAAGRPTLLSWETVTPDETELHHQDGDEGAPHRRVQSLSVRTWLARYDSSRNELSLATEVPTSGGSAASMTWVGDWLAVATVGHGSRVHVFRGELNLRSR